MTFRSIAVHVAPTDDGFNRLHMAVGLAGEFKARLIGLGVADVAETSMAMAGVSTLLIEQRQREFELALEALADRFCAAAAKLDSQWRSSLAPTVDYCVARARSADVMIVGRSTEHTPAPSFHLDATALVMRAGCPVIVVPPGVDRLSAQHVLVAWKGTREARLAVQLALPLLVRARSVTVAGVGDEVEDGELADIAELLELHGAAAGWRRLVQTEEPVAAALLGCAHELGADLIVNGAFHRGTAAEWLLGGVTRDLLASSPVCCLMAH